APAFLPLGPLCGNVQKCTDVIRLAEQACSRPPHAPCAEPTRTAPAHRPGAVSLLFAPATRGAGQSSSRSRERRVMWPSSSSMLPAQDLAAKAEQYDALADRVIDPHLAASLRRRAREWRDMADEVRVVQSDPMYRLIHDRQDHRQDR